jgi:hypothetical protein
MAKKRSTRKQTSTPKTTTSEQKPEKQPLFSTIHHHTNFIGLWVFPCPTG